MIAPEVKAEVVAKISQASVTKTEIDPTKTKVLGKRLQNVIASRRSGKQSKLPMNYTGLGSTTALEDLQRFNSNELNLELQGGRGKRKELYLKWLQEKETRRQEEMKKAKAKTREENKLKLNEQMEKQAERDGEDFYID